MERNKQKIIAILLIILLMGVLIYIGFKKYSSYKTQKKSDIFNQGVEQGYQQAIIQAVQMSKGCNPVPLRVGEEVTNVIDIRCFQPPTA